MKKNFLLLFLFPVSVCSAQWNNDVSKNLNTTENLGTYYNFQSVKTTDGKTWIAFYKQSAVTKNFDMWVQLLDVNGNKLLGDEGKLISDLRSGTYTLVFYTCIDSTNNLVIGFHHEKKGIKKAVVFKIDETGKKLWGNKGITLGDGVAPYVATLSTGETVVAWAANDDTLKMQKITSDGKTAWTTPVQLKVGSSALTQGQLVANLNGEFTTIMQKRGFTSYSILYAMRYNANGKPLWKNPVQLNNSSTQTYFTFPVLAEKDTTYISYFYIASFPEVKTSFLQRINPDGSLPYGINGSYFSLDKVSANQDYMSICTRNDLPYVWGVCTLSDLDQNKHGIRLQRFLKSNGARLMGDSAQLAFPLKLGGEIIIPSSALIKDDNLVFAHYDTTYRIAATRILSDKSGWHKSTTILSSTTATYSLPKGNFLFNYNNGQGVLLWVENRGAGYSIFAQNIKDDGTTGGIVLAVSGLNLKGSFTGDNVKLEWQTFSEKNTKGFYVEKSYNGSLFQQLSFAPSKALNGNSEQLINYSFVDSSNLKSSSTVYYRIKEIDYDNKFTYSNILSINNAGLSIKTLTVFPNPVINVITAKIKSPDDFPGTLSIINASGKLVVVKQIQVIKGEINQSINVSNLTSGTYFLKLLSEDGKVNVVSTFIK